MRSVFDSFQRTASKRWRPIWLEISTQLLDDCLLKNQQSRQHGNAIASIALIVSIAMLRDVVLDLMHVRRHDPHALR